MAFKYLLLVLLLLSCILSTAQTTSVLLNSASKSVARAKRAGSAVGKASGTVIQAGLTATRRSKKAADAVLAVGVKAGSAVAGASNKARRASQRTWEAARAAREAATAAYSDVVAKQQQGTKQQAQEVTEAVFPSLADPAAAAAAAAGTTQEECGLHDMGACSPTAAQVLPSAHTAPPIPPAEQGPTAEAEPSGAAVQQRSAIGLLLWTHLLALACGWLLHGRYMSTKQHKQQQQPDKGFVADGAGTGPAASSSGSSPARQQGSAHQQMQHQCARVNARSHSAAAPAGDEQHAAASSNGVPQAVDRRADAQAAGAAVARPAPNAVGTAPPAAPATPPPPAAGADAAEDVGSASDDGSFVVCEEGSQEGEGSSSNIATHPAGRRQHGRIKHHRGAAGSLKVSAGTRSYGLHRRRQPRLAHERQLVLAAQQHQQQQLLAAGQHALGAGQAVHVVGQQTMIINHNHLVVSDEVGQLLLPVAKVLQEVGENLGHISHVARRWVGWTGQQECQQRLAAQQELLDRASHFGQLLGLGVMGVVALRAGRLWEVHQVCHSNLQRSTGLMGWAHRMSGTQTLLDGLQYINCCSQQLGLYAAGLYVLYMLLRASVSGSGACRRTATGRPSNAFQLDLIVVKGLVCSWLGAHVVHCLGGAWLPWLAGWLLWCATQLWLSLWEVNTTHSGVSVVLVALVLPLIIALGPFQPLAILVQGWVVEVFPILSQVPSLGQVLLPTW